MTAIILIGANPIARAGINRILKEEGFNVTLSVPSVKDVAFLQKKTFLAIIDSAPLEPQPEIVRAVVAASSSLRPVVLSSRFDLDAMTRCFSAGAQGYLINDIGIDALAGSLRLIANGQKVMPSILVDQLATMTSKSLNPRNDQPLESAQLSQREQETLRCLVEGLSNKAIARHLSVSEATVKIHTKAVLRKLKVSNRTQAAMWAIERGIDPNGLDESCREPIAEMTAWVDRT